MTSLSFLDEDSPGGRYGSATFSDCNRYRYDLTRAWLEGSGVALVVMLNPSTADAINNDATITRVCNFVRRREARNKPVRELVVCNLFAYRSTDPDEMVKDAKSGIDIVGEDNDDMIRYHAERASIVIAAWGALPIAKARAADVCFGRGALADRMLHALKVTKDGAPSHPLYLKNETTIEPYYLSDLERWTRPKAKQRRS